MKITPVGVSFYKEDVENLKVGDELKLLHKPVSFGSGDKKKEYPNAIAIMHNDKQVGSLAESTHPSSPQRTILRLIQSGEEATGIVTDLVIPGENDKFKRTYGFESVVPDESDLVESFNEDVVISFNEATHVYEHKGEKLLSGSYWVSKHYTPFDAITIADRCSNVWGVDSKDITDMWSSGGKVAADFGTAIHQALEHWEKFKENGNTIFENSKKNENAALPKHPFLRKVINDFDKVKKDSGHEILTEVLVTNVELGLCGMIDRLIIVDRENKVCRVGDYKVNIGAEDKKDKALPPYDHLPPNKLTKYQLQLSFYAQLLILSGWTVQGLDAYVLEDEWKHYGLDLLDIDFSK